MNLWEKNSEFCDFILGDYEFFVDEEFSANIQMENWPFFDQF